MTKSKTSSNQPFVLLGKEYLGADKALDEIGKKVNLYYSANPEDSNSNSNIYHTPFFIFREKSNGEIDITLKPVLGSTTESEIQLVLLNSPASLKKKIADSIRHRESTNSTNTNLANITVDNIITIPFLGFSVDQDVPNPIFTRYYVPEEFLEEEIRLKARLPNDKAQNIYNQLLKQEASTEFWVRYRINARFIKSESSVESEGIYLYNTNAAKELAGKARAFKWSANYSGILSSDSTIVNRDQLETFKGRIRSDVRAWYQIEDPNDQELLEREYSKYFDQVFSPKTLSLDDGNFHYDFSKISSYDFSPKDILPDELKEIINDLKKKFESEDRDIIEISGEGKGKGDFLGLAGGEASGKVSYKKDQLRKLMKEKGWKFELKGDVYIPKSLDVYIINKKTLKQEGVVNIGVTRSYLAVLKGARKVTTMKKYYEKNVKDFISPYQDIFLNLCPLGTILSFAGGKEKIPFGWKICDGEFLSIGSNEKLFQIIGYNWGKNDKGEFKLPNLQGQFLRGVDYSKKIDPDVSKRKNSENKIGEIGSYQGDAFKKHYHHFAKAGMDIQGGGSDPVGGRLNWGDNYGFAHPRTNKDLNAGTSQETRPKNAYVNFIIRAI